MDHSVVSLIDNYWFIFYKQI